VCPSSFPGIGSSSRAESWSWTFQPISSRPARASKIWGKSQLKQQILLEEQIFEMADLLSVAAY